MNTPPALECHDGSVETLTAEKFVIACGSRPYHPADVDFSHPRIYDSDSILSLHHEPRHVIIYGAGVIGCEYASIFRGMEVKVDLINTRDRLLAFLDQGDVRFPLLPLLEQWRGDSPQRRVRENRRLR